MPITQRRMIAVLTAATAMRDAQNDFAAQIDDLLNRAVNGEFNLHTLMREIAILSARMRTELPMIIAQEQWHFNHEARRNERERKRQAARRAGYQSQYQQRPVYDSALAAAVEQAAKAIDSSAGITRGTVVEKEPDNPMSPEDVDDL